MVSTEDQAGGKKKREIPTVMIIWIIATMYLPKLNVNTTVREQQGVLVFLTVMTLDRWTISH